MSSTTSKPRRLFTKRNIIIALIIVALLLVALLIAVMSNRSSTSSNTSKNPIIGQYEEQLPTLAKKAQAEPKNAQAQHDYAVALYATGDVAKAKEQYVAQSKLTPKDATMHNNLGNTYRDLKDFEKAVKSYQESIKLDAKQVNAYVNLSNLYLYTLNKEDLAIKTLVDAVNAQPENQDLIVLLGIAYERSGDADKAREQFNLALSKNKQNKAAQAGLDRLK